MAIFRGTEVVVLAQIDDLGHYVVFRGARTVLGSARSLAQPASPSSQ